MALRERLVQLLAEKWDGNQSRMSEGCGLKRTHIGVILRRLQTDPQASIESDTLSKIAKGSGVSLAWLVGGEGVQPQERTIERDRFTYTELEPILAMLRAEGEPAGVIAALEAERLAPDAEGHNADYWWKRVDYYRAVRKGKVVQHTTDADDLDVPMPGRKGKS